MQPDLDRNAPIDQPAQLGEGFFESAFVILFPVATIAQRLRGVFPDLVECPRAAVKRRRAPNRAPAKREAVSGRPVGEQHIAFTMQTKHPEHTGKETSAGIVALTVALVL